MIRQGESTLIKYPSFAMHVQTPILPQLCRSISSYPYQGTPDGFHCLRYLSSDLHNAPTSKPIYAVLM